MSGELPEQKAKGIPLTRQTNEVGDPGLVICAITVREESPSKFPGQREMDDAINYVLKLPNQIEARSDESFTVSFSPGSIRTARTNTSRQGIRGENWKPKQAVIKWSNKSRAKMLERFSTLDFSQFVIEGSMLAFITLTYPADWLGVVPTCSDAKRQLQAFRKRFEREFGRPFFALWKMEFQRRGAPHFHILAPVPNGSEFRIWLSETWTQVVNHPDENERNKHRVAGTGIDKAKGITATNANRISYYFSKHSSANKGPKEYQNTPPAEWVENGSVGRFWGYWGLDIATSTIQLERDKALFIARTLRRWQQSKSRIVKTTVWRVNQSTGVVFKRKVSRRAKVLTSSFGFRIVPDGEEFARILTNYLAKQI